MDVWVKSIGEKRGAPYIYFDGQQAIRTGFSPGQKYDLDLVDGKVVLQANKDGSRTISSKVKNGEAFPVIDINSAELLSIFDGMTAIRVIIKKNAVYLLPLASEVKKKERLDRITSKLLNKTPLAMASLSHGGGVLSSAIHEGLTRAGIGANMAFANEIREDLLEHAIANNPVWNEQTMAICAPMQEAAQDDWLLSRLPQIEVLELGLPCSGASKAGASKRGLQKMEDHPEVGHLVFAALMILNKVQPSVVLLENVPEYAHSASASILRYQLRDMGYTVHEAILEGKDFGCLENRVRWCMCATTAGLEFDMSNLAPVVTIVKTLGEYLDESIGQDDPRYRAVQYLKDKMVRDASLGNSFAMQTITEDSTSIPTLRKGYHKGGSTDPRLLHQTDPDRSRLLTGIEHCRIKGVPESLINGLSDTTAHQLLGQGIVYAPFEAVGHRIGECLTKASLEREAVARKTPAPKRKSASYGIG